MWLWGYLRSILKCKTWDSSDIDGCEMKCSWIMQLRMRLASASIYLYDPIYTHIIMMIWSIICMWSWMVLCAEHVCTHDITWVEIHPRSFFSDLVFSVGLSEHGNIKLWVIAVPKFQWLSWQQIGPASPSISSLRTTFTVSIILKRLQK